MSRYEIIETIAKGDFATVLRARDLELGREVAVKQIHQQYLDDPRQLDRYWQEAQLLASLEHPHIMTIYDVVRERGWLILELMQGSLTQLLGDNPIDLKDLRLTLGYTLHALEFMHQHGIVHGDVKPSNLLVDRNHRVKLGDFGIARRIAGDEGSVVKGTTKYIAPEVVSDQFGEVGPHSDLYSLGFTAYELMCGAQFDSLFPGLNLYGRDRQMAWLMWHSAPDRRLPEIQRVLEGVPPDLTHIIHRLTEKDPGRRYRTARQVLDDLAREGEVPQEGPTPEEIAEAKLQAKQARRRRSLLIAAVTCSLVLSLGMLLFPSNNSSSPPAERPTQPRAGVIVEIDAPRSRIFVEPAGGGVAQGITVDPQLDRIRINDERAELADLSEGDAVRIRYLRSDEEEFKEILATRELALVQEGSIDRIDVYAKTVAASLAEDPSQLQEIAVGDAVVITFNGQTMLDGRRVRLEDLRPGDRVVAAHKAGQDGRRTAVSLQVLREFSLSGFVVQAGSGQLEVRIAPQWDSPQAVQRTLAVADDCEITLNGQNTSDGRPLTLLDLRPRDSISLRHDAQVQRIEAFRDVSVTGRIAAINYSRQTVQINGPDESPATFTAAAQCRIEIEGEQAAVGFDYLREGDLVTMQRRSPDPEDREVVLISVPVQHDPSAWALVIAYDKYDDPQMPELRYTAADAAHLREALRIQYRIPPTQLVYEVNATRLRLENTITQFLAQVPDQAQLIVYFVGHGYLGRQGTGFLAPQGFDERRVEATGLGIRWLIQQLESCPAREKLLLLDTTHEAGGQVPEWYASSAELAESAKDGPTRPVSASVTVIASCQKGEFALKLDSQARGLFGSLAAEAFAGKADDNRDHRVDRQELFRYVGLNAARKSIDLGRSQTPALFLPDATPPRLTAEARESVIRVLAYLNGSNDQQLAAEYEFARSQARGQPDADLAYALVQLKNKYTLISRQILEQVRLQHADALVAYHVLAWQYFLGSEYERGIESLEQFIRRLPSEQDDQMRAYAHHVIEFAGRLAAYSLRAAPPDRLLDADAIERLTDAVRQRGEEAFNRYTQGGRSVYDKTKTASDRDRTRLTYYADLDYDAVQSYLLSSLEK